MVSHCGWHSSLYSALQALLLFQGSCHSLVVTGDSAVEDAEAGMYNVDTSSEMTPQLAMSLHLNALALAVAGKGGVS